MRVLLFSSGLCGANEERPHQALGYRSPRQYQQQRLRAAERHGKSRERSVTGSR